MDAQGFVSKNKKKATKYESVSISYINIKLIRNDCNKKI